MKTEMLNKQKYFMQGLQATKNKTKTSQDAQKTIFFNSFCQYGNCRSILCKEFFANYKVTKYTNKG